MRCKDTQSSIELQGVSKKSEFSGNWLRKILLGSVRNPVGIIMTNPALLQYASHFIHHRKCVGYTQIQWNQFSLGFQQTVTRLGHIYLQGVSITFVHCVFFRQKKGYLSLSGAIKIPKIKKIISIQLLSKPKRLKNI